MLVTWNLQNCHLEVAASPNNQFFSFCGINSTANRALPEKVEYGGYLFFLSKVQKKRVEQERKISETQLDASISRTTGKTSSQSNHSQPQTSEVDPHHASPSAVSQTTVLKAKPKPKKGGAPTKRKLAANFGPT